MRDNLLKRGLQIEVPVKIMVYYKFPNLMKMTHIFPIKKDTGSFEKANKITVMGLRISCVQIHVGDSILY